jgi:hypothetical protein
VIGGYLILMNLSFPQEKIPEGKPTPLLPIILLMDSCSFRLSFTNAIQAFVHDFFKSHILFIKTFQF